MTRALLEAITLRGLDCAPCQTWGAIRLVPLCKREVRGDLRLAKRGYDDAAAVVSLAGEAMAPGLKYVSFVPHGLVLSWENDGTACAAFGGQLTAEDGKTIGKGARRVRVLHRMVRREDAKRLRFLPLHLAMEGFLAMHFGGPEIAWQEYSRRALSRGLDPRWEASVPGNAIAGLDDALRVFEVHERQVGVLLFVGDALAAAFVVPHPDDYRALHRTLLEDLYGTLVLRFGAYAQATKLRAAIDGARVSSLEDLRREVEAMRAAFRVVHQTMADGLLGARVRMQRVYTAGPFRLQRFVTPLDRHSEAHIGEVIVRKSGELEYLKTFRLSTAQIKRAFLLQKLHEHDWNLQATAIALHDTPVGLVRRLENAGFGYLLAEHVRAAARRKQGG